MIRINGHFVTKFEIELDVDSFEDICEEKMSRDQSDELISKVIKKEYGIWPQQIWVGREVKR